jgi:adenine phosphoribosyltransferase
MNFVSYVRAIPDHPKPGIMFRDITTLLGDAHAFRAAVNELVKPFAGVQIDKVVGIEARGFILGGAVAHQLSAGFVPARKRGKLPWRTIAQEYRLEYGVDVMEMHADALGPDDRVLLVDDLIATGGTALAALGLIQRLGGVCVGVAAVIDLPDLEGAERIRARGPPVQTLMAFEGH